MLTLASAVAATAPAATADEKWIAGTVVEPESVEDVAAATVTNADDLTLAVAREPGGERVIGILRLPPPDQDFLDDSRPVEIRIDDGPLYEPRRVGGGLKSSTFLLWDGAGEPAVGPLRDLMEAHERIVIEYPLAGGGYKEVAFAAAGAKSSIASVLGVAVEVSPEARELAVARQEAIDHCLDQEKPKDRDRCLERLAGCAAASTATELASCIGAAKK